MKKSNKNGAGVKSASKNKNKRNNVPKQNVAGSFQRQTALAPVSVGSKGSVLGGDIRVVRREFVTTLSADSDRFAIVDQSITTPGLDVNPANSVLFPWLSGIASSFEKYKFNKLSFNLVSQVPTSVPGRVYMSFDYDYSDPVATTKEEMMAMVGAVDSNAWMSPLLIIDVTRMNQGMEWRYTQRSVRAAQEPRTVYGGFLLIGTEIPSTGYTFDLWVTYEVILRLPQLSNFGTVQTVLVDNSTPPGTTAINYLELKSSTGWLEVVVPGSSGTPVLNNENIKTALDLRRVTEGTLVIAPDTSCSDTPSVLSPHVNTDAKIYSDSGNYLGLLGALSGKLAATGSKLSTQWSIGGSPVTSMFIATIQELRKQYPLVRYLVPILTNIAGPALSGISGKVRFEL